MRSTYEKIRKPTAKPSIVFKDRNKYNRKQKHSNKED